MWAEFWSGLLVAVQTLKTSSFPCILSKLFHLWKMASLNNSRILASRKAIWKMIYIPRMMERSSTLGMFRWVQGMNSKKSGSYKVHFLDFTVCLFIQVNLCQKLLFLHQLTHNMTKDCSLNSKFNTWKFQGQNWGEHVVNRNCFWHSEQVLYTTCSPPCCAKRRASDKDLPVLTQPKLQNRYFGQGWCL
jgi:hypothetical protein